MSNCGRGMNRSTTRCVDRNLTRYLLFSNGTAWSATPRPKQMDLGCTACPTRHRSRALDCVPSHRWPKCKQSTKGGVHGFDPVFRTPAIQFIFEDETGGRIIKPIAPNHPIVVSCINGGFHAPVGNDDELEGATLAEQRQCNFFIPAFAPLFTPRVPPEGHDAPLVVANTSFINNEQWKFFGIAFTGCTIDEALRLSMAPTKTAQTARVAVIVGGSCTVASPTEGNYSVTDSITFGTRDGLPLNAPGIPNDYRQSTPIQWNYREEMDALADGEPADHAELVVIDAGGNQVTQFSRRNNGLAMAGVVLDTGPGGDVRILLK